jgi:hypothetical protein
MLDLKSQDASFISGCTDDGLARATTATTTNSMHEKRNHLFRFRDTSENSTRVAINNKT